MNRLPLNMELLYKELDYILYVVVSEWSIQFYKL